MNNNDRRTGYCVPDIQTIKVSDLLEMIGPAQGFSSGAPSPNDPMETYPTAFGPGGGMGNINKN